MKPKKVEKGNSYIRRIVVGVIWSVILQLSLAGIFSVLLIKEVIKMDSVGACGGVIRFVSIFAAVLISICNHKDQKWIVSISVWLSAFLLWLLMAYMVFSGVESSFIPALFVSFAAAAAGVLLVITKKRGHSGRVRFR